jgi:hypothetical protein
MTRAPATLEYAFTAPPAPDHAADAALSSRATVALWAAFAYVVACVVGLLVLGTVMALRV